MSRVSGCLWLGVALILALVAGGVAFVTLQRATATKAQVDAPIATTEVVVAAHPMPIGTLLTEKDLTVQSLPTGALPAGTLSKIADANGQLTTVSLEAGEMVLAHHITPPDISGDNLAFTLPEGLVAVTLSPDDLLSQLSLVKPGDHVDLLYTLNLQEQSPSTNGAAVSKGDSQFTFGTLQNLTIVSVVGSSLTATDTSASKDAAAAKPAAIRAYILGLEPQDALVLKYLKDAGAVMDLAMRNTADEGDHTTQPVNQQYVIDRFQLQKR